MNWFFQKMRRRWNTYWFTEVSSLGFEVFRIAFGFVLLVYHFPRVFYIRDLYTNTGFIHQADFFYILAFIPDFPVPSFGVAVLLNIILYIAIITLIIGYRTRLSVLTIFLLHVYLSSIENFSTKGYGLIIMIYLLLLLPSPVGSFLSLDFSRTNRNLGLSLKSLFFSNINLPRVPITMQRIMTWQLSSIYFFNVLTKVKINSDGWFDGTNIFNMYRDVEKFARPFMAPFVENFHPYLPAFGFLTIFSLFFIAFGLLNRNTRPYAITLGVLYHSSVLITMSVPYVFSLLMFSLYLITIEAETWNRWWLKLQKKTKS